MMGRSHVFACVLGCETFTDHLFEQRDIAAFEEGHCSVSAYDAIISRFLSFCGCIHTLRDCELIESGEEIHRASMSCHLLKMT